MRERSAAEPAGARDDGLDLHHAFARALELRGDGAAPEAAVRPDDVMDRRLAYLERVGELLNRPGWSWATVGCYADFLYLAQIGRAILLPTAGDALPAAVPPPPWPETEHAREVAVALLGDEARQREQIAVILRALTAVARAAGRHWSTDEALHRSLAYPVVQLLEGAGHAVVDAAVTPDTVLRFRTILAACRHVGALHTAELALLVAEGADWLAAQQGVRPPVPAREERLIAREPGFAVDRVYVASAAEIHTPPERIEYALGALTIPRRTVVLRGQVPGPAPSDAEIAHLADAVRLYLGSTGARVVQLLYQIANDPPYWRQPVITVDTNELLDRMGWKRDARGIHYSRNRERLRDVLTAAHMLEVVGEYRERRAGREVRVAMRHTVLSLIGAEYDSAETRGLGTELLFQRGLPTRMRIRLNFYDGVRQPDGRLGARYVLMPRSDTPGRQPLTRTVSKAERLKPYILLRCREACSVDRTITLARPTALEQADIKSRHVTRATQVLTRALQQLVADGVLERFDPVPLPTAPSQEFAVVVTPRTAAAQAL